MSQPNDPGSSKPQMPPSGKSGSHVFQAPTGTRDFYPAELNRLRYIQDAWRTTAINHGFDEIDGPTFEHLDLYTVKSGEGIVSELFSFERFGGEKTFALRPEFTPTLARMYASKAASLPKPTKWFWMQNCFRAERPQRGRLREFWQWNCDIMGDDSAAADAECIACCVGVLESLGLGPKDVVVKLSHRALLGHLLAIRGIGEESQGNWLSWLDAYDKRSVEERRRAALAFGATEKQLFDLEDFARDQRDPRRITRAEESLKARGQDALLEQVVTAAQEHVRDMMGASTERLRDVQRILDGYGMLKWCDVDSTITRGLAYYTGMVFEVHEASGAERAIAGGGRYDKLIEMFGGPPTPAVGFGMGDVVLSLVLQDKGLMPKDDEVAAKLGLNPDALVVSNGTPEADGAVAGVVASLRRAGLHARRSSKKIGKAIQDASKLRARYCVILESADAATVKDMGTQGQEVCGVAELVSHIRR